MGFPEGCEVAVQQAGDKNWLTRAAIHYTGKVETFEVPECSTTDFASVFGGPRSRTVRPGEILSCSPTSLAW